MRNILALLVVIALSSSVSAEVECPFGLVNDTYPGDCGRYIDINGDGICDYSQPEPSSAAVPAGETPMLSASQSVHPQSLFDRYHFFQITFGVLLAIALSELLIKNKLLVKYIWNVALMVSFAAAAITSLLYFLRLEGVHATVITLHIELGLIMVWIGLYHAAKRMYFYTKCAPWRACRVQPAKPKRKPAKAE